MGARICNLIASRLLPIVLSAGLAAFALAVPAHATVIFNSPTSVTVNAAGDTFGVNYSCAANTDCGGEGLPLTTMTAMSFWTVFSIDAGEIVFDITIMNTTPDLPGNGDRVTQFGTQFMTPGPGAVSIDNSGSPLSLDWGANVNVNFPNFNPSALSIEEDGPGNAGLKSGETDTMRVTLSGFSGSLMTAGLTLDTFPIKYQGIPGTLEDKDSWQFAGTLKKEVTQIPEPSTLALFGFGLAGLGVMTRRRRSARV